MATNTYVALATTTVGTATSSVVFSSISGSYTDLVLVGSALTSTTGYSMTFGVNGDTNTNYSITLLSGSGTAAQSVRYSNISNTETYIGGWVGGYTSGTPTTFLMNFQNYSNTITHKTVLSRNSGPSKSTEAVVALWRNTAAITSITIYAQPGSTIAVGSTFSLYGILAEGGAKATGGVVTSDANYYYHTFLASGTFTPLSTITVDYLVVAGGAGGGGGNGGDGAGGAGGMRCTVTNTGGGGALETALTLAPNTNYTVTIGAGGAAGVNNSSRGSVGANSVFSTITSTGGGGGGAGAGTSAGIAGGSGGGSGYGGGAGGSATPSGQGFAGGIGGITASSNSQGGGGGGAGAVGGNQTTNTAGNGGTGVATSISGSSVTYAGGGGGGQEGQTLGGTGGAGGGGRGAVSGAIGVSGTANLGGGGGGGGYSGSSKLGGAGGSGIVIIRYAL
jgi:hypothetical protein